MESSKRIYLSPPSLSGKEMEYLSQTIHSNWIAPAGPNLETFEKDICTYTGSKYAVAVSSGTAAIHLSLIIAGVTEGDYVLCPSLTFAATVNPVLYQRAIPVFIDSETDTWNICPETLMIAIAHLKKLNKKPKAIIIVHLYGYPAKMNEILAICSENDIRVIEDAAESLGATFENKMTGTFGNLGVYSFNGNKIITTSAGGMVVTEDKKFAAEVLHLSTQAKEAYPYYYHQKVGYNYRMSNVLAAIGIGQLEQISNKIRAKKKIFDYYTLELKSAGIFTFHPAQQHATPNYWLTTMLIDPGLLRDISPESLRLALEKDNIETRAIWNPLHTQPAYSRFPFYGSGVCLELYDRGLCLPSGSDLAINDLERIVSSIQNNI